MYGSMPFGLHREGTESILRLLDNRSLSAMACTCRRVAELVQSLRHSGFIPPPAASTVSFALASSASSASSKNADEDPLANTDTDMEEEWEFQLTPEIIRRLQLIPMQEAAPSLSQLPTELKLEVFSYLDLIDSTCLGLASPPLYVVHRAIHGTKIPLNTRRVGPNRLESAWEVVGKQECKQCGIYRCELHQHIKTWMPKELEYCSMKVNFGLPAKHDAVHQTCYRGKPSKPKRCGRHPLRTTSVHQDDSAFNLPSV
ncbi:uncharacterized protein L3040_005640 [Drepanopeziza brunnea f. sp. 'multigermtubi']|uniref:uncharacterized protein n=1 Tax=Drepanopeziza brunnea f. sp. 'multigermtubi' TaxID=698441 RepID=UPI002385CC9C|nr:hypothetical protein L3040_005640 [Drepanopeziza brunnea f. sp. 'multigermtubi']